VNEQTLKLVCKNVYNWLYKYITDGKFEITEEDSIVVTGTVHETSNPKQEMIPTNLLLKNNEEHMSTRDIYTRN